MKASNYLVKYVDGDYYVVISTKSRKAVRFPLEEIDYVERLLNGEISLANDEVVNALWKDGFLVSDESDEIYEMKQKCIELVNSDTLYLTIMPAYTCNLACIYCFQHHKSGAVMSSETSQSLINFVRKSIGKYKAIYVEWFGGEPLVAKEQVVYMNQEICKICRENRKPYISRITTNGYELDIDTFNKLQEYNCLVYYVSVDCGKEMHDVQRPRRDGTGSYDRIMHNLKAIKSRALSRNFRVEIRVNCSVEAYKHLEEFLSEIEETFGDDRRFSLVIAAVKDWSERTEKMREDGELIGDAGVADLASIAKRYNINMAPDDVHALDTQICQAAKRNAYIINYDGSVHKCQMALESEQYSGIDKIGEVSLDGELLIDSEQEARWVRNDFRKECNTCCLLPLCLGKKCVYQTVIEEENCEDVVDKFINEFSTHEMSKLESMQLFSLTM